MAEEPQTTGETQKKIPRAPRRGLTLEVLGEIILLIAVGAMFAYLFIESFNWPPGSALMPRITVAIGTPFWFWRLFRLIKSTQEVPSRQIMDLGFRTGADPQGERVRFFRITAYILGLYLAIWLLGFHIALPVGVAFYAYVYGRVGWIWSAVIGVVFLALILGVYDHFLAATWHEPPLLKMFWG